MSLTSQTRWHNFYQMDSKPAFYLSSTTTKPHALLGTTIFLVILIAASPCLGKPELLEISLARNIENRNPTKPHSPFVSCEKDRNHDAHLPIINASIDDKIVFWNRVMAKSPTIFHHTWHKKNSDRWKKIAHVSLKIRKSSSFRTWSTKTILPRLHIGEWMIVVSVNNDPQDVLCIVRFIVK